jgi:hypothetical protein
MKKILLLIAVILLITTAYALWQKSNANKMNAGGISKNENNNFVSMNDDYAFVYSVVDNAYVIKNNNKIKLSLGDKIVSGEIVETDSSGDLILRMPDNSELRISENTKIVLQKVEIDKNATNNQNTQKVTVYLDFGKVWSKVKSLSNSQSSWEIETSNAVATVRGTSFGLEKSATNTRVIGAENTVAVRKKTKNNNNNNAASSSATNSQKTTTKETAEEKELLIKEGNYVDIFEDEVEKNRSKDHKVIKKIPDEMKQDKWMQKELGSDINWNKENNNTNANENILKNFGKEIKEIEIEDRKEKVKERLENKIQIQNSTPSSTKATNTLSTTTDKNKRILRLEINNFNKIILLDSKVILQANIVYSDGSKKDVTSETSFSLSNKLIGSISKNVYYPDVSDDIKDDSELRGTIKATYKDSLTGQIYNSTSNEYEIGFEEDLKFING